MKKILMLASFWIFVPHCVAADANPQKVRGDGFTINLPANWEAIPKEVLDAMSSAMVDAAPRSEKQNYDHGFQLSSSENWMEYPYILVQVAKGGKIPESEFQSMDRVEAGMNEGAAKAEDSISEFASDSKVKQANYDPVMHVLWSQIEMNVAGIGAVKGLFGIRLTEKGTIRLYCFSKADEFGKYEGEFRAIVEGVEVDDKLKYKPGLGDRGSTRGGFDWKQNLASGVAGGILGGLIYGFAAAGKFVKSRFSSQRKDIN